MKEAEHRILEATETVAFEFADKVLNSPQVAALKAAMRKASAALPEDYSLTFDITLNVFDHERGQALPLLTTGLSSFADKEPYVHSGDSTIARYLVDGEICELPHDRCPHCWGLWDFKIGQPEVLPGERPCPTCGYRLGDQVKLLLDNDLCPNCEKKKITSSQPACARCGFKIDPKFVAWG